MSINFGLSTKILLVLNPCSVLVVLLFASPLYRKPTAGKKQLVTAMCNLLFTCPPPFFKSYSSRKKKMIPAAALSVLSWW